MTTAALLATTVVRADAPAVDDGTWVAPAMLDDVPVRSLALPPHDAAVPPTPIVVPLPTGLETGGFSLAAIAAARWWTSRRRQRA